MVAGVRFVIPGRRPSDHILLLMAGLDPAIQTSAVWLDHRATRAAWYARMGARFARHAGAARGPVMRAKD